MEIFLVIVVIAMNAVVIVDTGRKRRAYLCQQVEATKRPDRTKK